MFNEVIGFLLRRPQRLFSFLARRNVLKKRHKIALDCCHLYSHIDEGRVFPITYNVGDTLEGYKTLLKLSSSRHHMVPGHDPQVLTLYPAAKPNLENWVVRLDAEPNA